SSRMPSATRRRARGSSRSSPSHTATAATADSRRSSARTSRATATSSPPSTDPFTVLRQYAELRPGDVSFMIDRVLDDAGELAANIDPERIGMMGHSFGGWTTLAVTGRDPRIRAALPLDPAGGTNPIT